MKSTDITSLNIEKIAALFPNCVTETAEGKRIDFDLLKQELSNQIVEGNKERYRLEWPGKREAIVTANIPTTNTLRPVREDSVDFDTTENIYIEGDNLEVLKLLQESYLGKIKMIYIDPPYNTGKDFVYKDNFAKDGDEELFESGQKDEYNQKLVQNPETSGRYHSDWLSMMYPRLKLARNLLTDDGVIFISIGSDEIANLTRVCDEIFGETNRIAIVGRQAKSGGNKGRFFSPNIEYLLVYSRNITNVNSFSDDMDPQLIKKVYTKVQVDGERKGEKYRAMGLYQSSLDARANQRYFIEAPDGSLVIPPGSELPAIKKEGEKIVPKNIEDGCWRWTYETYLLEKAKGNIEFSKTNSKVLVDENGGFSEWNLNTKIWLKDRQEAGQLPNDLILKYENRHSAKELKDLEIPFDFAKPTGLIKYLAKISQTGDNDIILDFFSGSATTAHAVMQLNAEDASTGSAQVGKRKYIMVQLPEATDEKSEAYKAGYKNICEIGKERIRRAAKSISNEEITNYESKKNTLEKMIGKSLVEKDDEISFPNDAIIDEKAENLLQELRNLKFAIRNSDKGFRVYRLDSSNMQDVYYKPQDYTQNTLDLFADNVKEGRTAEDLVTQIMLDWGLPLSLPIERKTISGKEVYAVAGNSLYCCFDKDIDEAFAKEVAKDQPMRIVFRDKGFKDDTAKENVKQLIKQLSPNTEMKVI
ncbi:site-specific DNA-methyltransferase [Flavobacterium sp. CBA20B-1]|uniref:site-specific DNA-methyltransferase n=1 Tax=unclassified Flavobacterium TaxID=196869 RepID=UPI002224BCF2|nr:MULTISPECIES: site-specific DNA-methyltransferase [unclassified Flavobacterium]WCM42538.1 site-specific DNA-methyltransferase [Flavobacterium sp. CBA20B-1]